MSKRPWRTEFFSRFASEIASASPPVRRVLELGSGPGFLAAHILGAVSEETEYVLLDFSASMHELAKARLSEFSTRIQFIERSFKEPSWPAGLGSFECVVTNQAIHELRHKRHAPVLHAQVRSLLSPGGMYLACDHFAGEEGMKNEQLYMTVAEQKQALLAAGFTSVEQLLVTGGLVLHHAA